MKALIVAFTALAMAWSTLSAADTASPCDASRGFTPGMAPGFAPGAAQGLSLGTALSYAAPGGFASTGDREGRRGYPPGLESDLNSDREETKSRKFEVVFLTSLPVSVLLSLLGTVALRSAAGSSGDFSSVEYSYLALSTIGISLGIAVSDSIKTGSGKPHRRERR